MDVLDESEASDIPFIIVGWVWEDVGFSFCGACVELVIVFPVRDCSCCADFCDCYPSDRALLIILHGVDLNGAVGDFF